MPPALFVFLVAALLTAAMGFWVLRAYRAAGAKTPMPALISVGLVAITTLVAYLFVGRPDLPNQPYRPRIEATMERPMSSWTIDEFLAVQAERTKANPSDPLPPFFAGEALMRLDRPQEAARQYDLALRREPRLAEAMLGLGRALVRINGAVTPEALELFQQAGALTNDPAPWIYQAMAAMQQNRPDEARQFWREAYNRLPPEDPRREMARRASEGEME